MPEKPFHFLKFENKPFSFKENPFHFLKKTFSPKSTLFKLFSDFQNPIKLFQSCVSICSVVNLNTSSFFCLSFLSEEFMIFDKDVTCKAFQRSYFTLSALLCNFQTNGWMKYNKGDKHQIYCRGLNSCLKVCWQKSIFMQNWENNCPPDL